MKYVLLNATDVVSFTKHEHTDVYWCPGARDDRTDVDSLNFNIGIISI